MTELPEWEMNDDGTITCSSLKHAKALLYTFVETAIAHNDKLFADRKLIEIAETPEVKPLKFEEAKEAVAEMRIERAERPTKVAVNRILLGSYTTAGITQWWKRPRKEFDGLTPTAMWVIDPHRVTALVRSINSGE